MSPTAATDTAYVEEISPGSGRRVAPRAHLRTTAPALDLCGDWRFRLYPSAGEADAAASETDYDDSDWDTIDVPSHWVLRGDGRWGRPAYTNVKYPFPLDPPHVPDANPTGDHRRRFDLPAAWLASGRVWLRFDGLESLGRVWLNGDEVGVVRGSRLRQELDVTNSLREGENTLVVRVHQWSAMSYIEDQDQWWLPGLFREVTLLHRPDAGLDDVWLRADRDPATGLGTLTVELTCPPEAYPVRVTCAALGLDAELPDATAANILDVGPVEAWSADAPRLYEVEVANAAETLLVRTGFRRVEVVGDAWLVNGRRLRLRGVNRHDFDPVEGRVFDAAKVREAMLLMKRHHLNAIRTSHYPPHPVLLDLADELGFWVIDECDLETHGFETNGWVGNPSDDPDWREVYLDRAHRIRGGVGDVADILQDLIEAHNLEIRRIHGQGHAIDERIDLVHSGLERFRDALHAFKRRVELLLHFVDRGARFAHGDDKLDHEPHQSHAEHHVHDRQNHAHNFAEIHQTPPSYIHIRRQL